MESNSYAGVVIIGLKAPLDLLYYEIPEQFKTLVKIGSRVVVPYGEKNERKVAVVFDKSDMQPSFDLKLLNEVLIGDALNTNLIELVRFASDTFLVPLHTLVNDYIGTIENDVFVKFVECLNQEKLLEIVQTSKGKKQQLVTQILENSPVRFSTLRKSIGTTFSRYIVELEQIKAIKITEKNTEKPKRLLAITANDSSFLESKIKAFDSSIRNSSFKIVKVFLSSKNNVIDETTVTFNVRNSAKAVEKLVEVGILKETHLEQKSQRDDIKSRHKLLLGGGLVERSNKIISLIKNKNSAYKTLVIFPELALIEKVKGMYREAFGENLISWNGHDASSFVSKSRANKLVILATETMLFADIRDLETIILEDASSKYFKPNSFAPFEARTIAIKKASLEHLDLLFSASTADDSLFYLWKTGFFENVEISKPTSKIKVIDMRTEFKNKNHNMLSYYMKRRINETLRSNGNVALILNRKPFSTFVMCRECGYVMKCKSCGNTLYFDGDKKMLYCAVCGYEEVAPIECPRCKSPSIYYFGGGIQKLIPEIKSTFPNANIVKMVSGDYSNKLIIDSKNFNSTIFVGTEFLLSHLNEENIAFFGFVGVDTFIENYGYESGVNAFKIVLDVANELHGHEIVLQTYSPENYIVSAMKSLEFKYFLEEELSLRKALYYPPYFNLISLNIQNVESDKAKAIKDYLEENLKDQAYVLGPSKSNIPGIFEVTLKFTTSTALIKATLTRASRQFKVEFGVRVYPSFV